MDRPFFLVPLLIGFALNAASAFTGTYSRWWGEQAGQLASLVLRMFMGMPLWIAGLALAMRAPYSRILPASLCMDVLGWLLVAAGCVPIIWGLLWLGKRAAAPSVMDALEAHGPYAYVRHPIYSGMLLEFAGLALLGRTLATLSASLLGIAWVFLQARLEEIDLQQRMPGYNEYMAQVPRFVPRLHRGQQL